MTLTIDLPEERAFRLNALLPEEARQRFVVSAIADALPAQEQDSAECIAAVEEALADMEMGRSISFEEEKARWQQKADLLAMSNIHAK
jgi:predicted transcriptional regulator